MAMTDGNGKIIPTPPRIKAVHDNGQEPASEQTAPIDELEKKKEVLQSPQMPVNRHHPHNIFSTEQSPPSFKYDPIQQVLGNPTYQLAVCSIEHFFATYIDTLCTKIEQLPEESQLSEFVVCRAVMLVKDLRELVTSHCFANFSSKTSERDLFFCENSIPRLTPVHAGDFVAEEAIPLGQYLRRYALRYRIEPDPVLSCLDAGVLNVGVCAIERGVHFLIMPKHTTLLEAVINNKLTGTISPNF